MYIFMHMYICIRGLRNAYSIGRWSVEVRRKGSEGKNGRESEMESLLSLFYFFLFFFF